MRLFLEVIHIKLVVAVMAKLLLNQSDIIGKILIYVSISSIYTI